MDVSFELETTVAGACCDLCGYPRRGLSADARCPECGEPPPQLHSSENFPARTREELAWLRTIAIGLWLLVGASLAALQVALVMPAEELSIGAINFPGPKVHAAAMVQRSIGGQPGPWGVAGTFWAMATVLAVWLITERRALRGDQENLLTLRSVTRWTAVITAGGIAGLLLSGAERYVPFHSPISLNLYFNAVAFCELPATTMLYFYLRGLARRLEDRRSTAILNVCLWAVPAVMGTAVFLLAGGEALNRATARPWRLICIAYGGAALATGVAATAAVARLAMVTTLAARTSSFRGTLLAVPQMIRRAVKSVDANLSRWCVAGGLVLLLWGVPANIESVIGMISRKGLAGDMPMLNFPGPKMLTSRVVAAVIIERSVNYYPPPAGYIYFWPAVNNVFFPALLNLLAVWLVTSRGEPVDEDSPAIPAALTRSAARLRSATRWTATAAIAGALGFALSHSWPDGVSPARVTAWVSLFCEAPATGLLYLYLSRLASNRTGTNLSRATRYATTLRRMAIVAPLLILTPLLAFALSISGRAWRWSPAVGVICGAFVALELAATLTACSAIAQLAWDIARPTPITGPNSVLAVD